MLKDIYWYRCFSDGKFFNGLVIGFFCVIGLLQGCVRIQPQPHHLENICLIFQEYPDWYWTTQKTKQHWKIPIWTQMAIMYQESSFRASARPPRRPHGFLFLPGKHISTALGYSQALDGTWRGYQYQVGHRRVSRVRFSDADDFVGWFSYHAHLEDNIPRWDTEKLYLAYHEGLAGYRNRSYRQKKWLMRVAKRVERIAFIYHQQLRHCQTRLEQRS